MHMANKNRNLIIAYFPSVDEAKKAADNLRNWDKASDNIKLGGIGIITEDDDGKLKTQKVGARAAGTGAKWGTIVGAVAGIFSGGITLIGGAIVGLAAGSVAGALFHKHIGMEDHDKERLLQHLKNGGAALAVMADDEEVNPAKAELARLDGEVESYLVPDETVEELETAADNADVEEVEVAVLGAEDAAGEEIAVAAVAAGATEVADGDEVTGVETLVVESAEALLAVIHYHRHNGDYDNWGLHVWSGYEGEANWEQPIPPTGMDDYGIYFAVPLAEDAQGLGYIIHKGDEKDLWDDQYLDFDADGYEVWIIQNTPGFVPPPQVDPEAQNSDE
jgi:uncharacterized membrane protein